MRLRCNAHGPFLMIGALKTRRMKWTRPGKSAYFKGLIKKRGLQLMDDP